MRTRPAFAAALTLGLALAVPGVAVPSAHALPDPGWTVPGCTEVGSDGTLSYTRDEMATLAPPTGMTHTTKYQMGLVTLTWPGHLLAVDNRGRISLSTDAGCTWLVLTQLSGYAAYPQIAAAPDGTAYLWTQNNRLFRYDDRDLTELPAPAQERDSITQLRVDPFDAEHLRAVTDDRLVIDSIDGGQTWTKLGEVEVRWSIYDAAIDPLDLDHIVVGTSDEGVRTTYDGGATWQAAQIGTPGERMNAFTVAISPANRDVVYVQGLDLAEHDEGGSSAGRHVYRSTDGGLTFTPIVDQEGEITLANGIPLFPHPTDPNVVYFTWGTSFMGIGSYLYRWDARTGETTWTHTWQHKIGAVAFHPRRPSIMYLGFGLEKIS